MILSQMAELNKRLDNMRASMHQIQSCGCEICGDGHPSSECPMVEFQNTPQRFQNNQGFQNAIQGGPEQSLEEMMSSIFQNQQNQSAQIEARLQQQEAFMQIMQTQIGQLANMQSRRLQGSLPSNTEKNHKEEAKPITPRSGLVVEPEHAVDDSERSSGEAQTKATISEGNMKGHIGNTKSHVEDGSKKNEKKGESKVTAESVHKEETPKKKLSSENPKPYTPPVPFPERLGQHTETLDAKVENCEKPRASPEKKRCNDTYKKEKRRRNNQRRRRKRRERRVSQKVLVHNSNLPSSTGERRAQREGSATVAQMSSYRAREIDRGKQGLLKVNIKKLLPYIDGMVTDKDHFPFEAP